MKTRLTPSKKGRSMLLTFHEGFSTYTITLPMPYGVRFFAEGLVSSLEMLHEQSDVWRELSGKDGEKAFIQEMVRRAAGLYDRFLKEEQE